MSPHSDQEAQLDGIQRRLLRLHNEPKNDETERRARAICENGGMVGLGVGGRRIVAALGNGAVAKFAWRSTGLSDNEAEWRVWAGAPAELRRLLAPTLYHTSEGVNIQRRCSPVEALEVANLTSLMRQLVAAGIVDAAVNLGVYEGRAVCFDYAMLSPARAGQLFAPLSELQAFDSTPS